MKKTLISFLISIVILSTVSFSAYAQTYGVGLVPEGTDPPTTCKSGSLFRDTDDDITYICEPADTWNAIGGGDYETDTHADEHNDGGADEIDRFTKNVTVGTFTGADATPDVSNGTSSIVHVWRTADTTTITHFDDGDDLSEYADGEWFILIFDHAAVIDVDGDPGTIKGHGGINYTAAAGEFALFELDKTSGYWMFHPNETKAQTFSTLRMPNHESTDAVLANLGEVYAKATDDAIAVHLGTAGEITGETLISAIQTKSWTFDPVTVYDSTLHRLFLMWVGDDAPNGITIDEWKVSFDADPTAEAVFDLKWADAMIGVANATLIDQCDTAVGVSAEDTEGSMENSGAVIANGKVLYLEFQSAYAEAGHQVMFQIWYHPEED